MKSFNKSAVLALIFVAGGAIAPAHAAISSAGVAACICAGAASATVSSFFAYKVGATDAFAFTRDPKVSKEAKDAAGYLEGVARFTALLASSAVAAGFMGAGQASFEEKSEKRFIVFAADALFAGLIKGKSHYADHNRSVYNFIMPALKTSVFTGLYNSCINWLLW